MNVRGRDHDMLLLGQIFKWYGETVSSMAAHSTAYDTVECEIPLGAGELADLLAEGGLPALVFTTKHGITMDCVREFADRGAVALFDAWEEDNPGARCWRVLGDVVPGKGPGQTRSGAAWIV